MVRKGYPGEYRIKKLLQSEFGKYSTIKVAIGGSSDFLVASCGELIKVVEVKETKKKYYYPNPREKLQFQEIINFADFHKIPAELIVIFKKGKGKPLIKHTKFLYEPK